MRHEIMLHAHDRPVPRPVRCSCPDCEDAEFRGDVGALALGIVLALPISAVLTLINKWSAIVAAFS